MKYTNGTTMTEDERLKYTNGTIMTVEDERLYKILEYVKWPLLASLWTLVGVLVGLGIAST